MESKNCTAYINLSGGVDSTYYLWRWLKENQSEKILVHHCLLNKSRREVEKQATDNILEFMRNSGYDNFEYIESQFTRDGIRGFIFDVDVIGFMTGVILSNKKRYPDIKKIILSYCHEETPIIRGHFEKQGTLKTLPTKHRTGRFVKVSQITAQREFEYEIPYMNKTKQDMIAEMPTELFGVTWYCRNPKEGKPCMKCFNCRRVNKKQINK